MTTTCSSDGAARSSRMLKKASSFVLVHPLHVGPVARGQATGTPNGYPSEAQRTIHPLHFEEQRVPGTPSPPRSLRPRWTTFLNIL